MQKDIILPAHNLRLVNFNSLLCEKIDAQLIDSLHEFNLLSKANLRNRDTRNFFYHHIVLAICEEIISSNESNKVIVYFNNSLLEKTELLEHYNDEDLIVFLESIMMKIRRILPIRVYITNHTFDYFVHMISKYDGRIKEILIKLKILADSVDIESYTFMKAKRFARLNNLTFLSNVYFSNLKTKQLLIF